MASNESDSTPEDSKSKKKLSREALISNNITYDEQVVSIAELRKQLRERGSSEYGADVAEMILHFEGILSHQSYERLDVRDKQRVDVTTPEPKLEKPPDYHEDVDRFKLARKISFHDAVFAQAIKVLDRVHILTKHSAESSWDQVVDEIFGDVKEQLQNKVHRDQWTMNEFDNSVTYHGPLHTFNNGKEVLREMVPPSAKELPASRPDRYAAFPIYDGMEQNRHMKDDNVSNFHLSNLVNLEEHGLRSCPVNALAVKNPDDQKYLLCYPWAIVEDKVQEPGTYETNRCFWQAANGTAISLALLLNLCQYEGDYQMSKFPPLAAFTFIGPKARFWLSIVTEPSNTGKEKPHPEFKMHCLWTGDVSSVWDTVQLIHIVRGYSLWAQTRLRRWISNCITTWKIRTAGVTDTPSGDRTNASETQTGQVEQREAISSSNVVEPPDRKTTISTPPILSIAEKSLHSESFERIITDTPGDNISGLKSNQATLEMSQKPAYSSTSFNEAASEQLGAEEDNTLQSSLYLSSTATTSKAEVAEQTARTRVPVIAIDAELDNINAGTSKNRDQGLGIHQSSGSEASRSIGPESRTYQYGDSKTVFIFDVSSAGSDIARRPFAQARGARGRSASNTLESHSLERGTEETSNNSQAGSQRARSAIDESRERISPKTWTLFGDETENRRGNGMSLCGRKPEFTFSVPFNLPDLKSLRGKNDPYAFPGIFVEDVVNIQPEKSKTINASAERRIDLANSVAPWTQVAVTSQDSATDNSNRWGRKRENSHVLSFRESEQPSAVKRSRNYSNIVVKLPPPKSSLNYGPSEFARDSKVGKETQKDGDRDENNDEDADNDDDNDYDEGDESRDEDKDEAESQVASKDGDDGQDCKDKDAKQDGDEYYGNDSEVMGRKNASNIYCPSRRLRSASGTPPGKQKPRDEYEDGNGNEDQDGTEDADDEDGDGDVDEREDIDDEDKDDKDSSVGGTSNCGADTTNEFDEPAHLADFLSNGPLDPSDDSRDETFECPSESSSNCSDGTGSLVDDESLTIRGLAELRLRQ